jgi:hypothetical protein
LGHIWGLTSHQIQAIDAAAVDVAALRVIDARDIYTENPQHIGKAHDILMDRVVARKSSVQNPIPTVKLLPQPNEKPAPHVAGFTFMSF